MLAQQHLVCRVEYGQTIRESVFQMKAIILYDDEDGGCWRLLEVAFESFESCENVLLDVQPYF